MECEDSVDTDIEIDVVDLDEDLSSPPREEVFKGDQTGSVKGDKEGKVRDPHCQQCAAHGKNFPLKNHKKICPFKNCECKKCKIVFRRRSLMAKQIKLRRQQKQKKQMESAATELRKQLEKAAERQQQGLFQKKLHDMFCQV